MPRPPKLRCITGEPGALKFKPVGIPARQLKHIQLTMDEFEALRLADYHAHSHEEAAAHMGVSRATFGRIIESARKKTADALLNAKALRIEGGPIAPDNDESDESDKIKCTKCGEMVPGMK